MDLSQQRFAVEVLQCAIGTVAKYEMGYPPEVDMLYRLAAIAYQEQRKHEGDEERAQELKQIGDAFTDAALQERKKKWAKTKAQYPDLVVVPGTDTEPARCNLVQQFDGRNRMYLATATQLLDARVSAGDAKALLLLTQLVTGIQELYKDTPLVYKTAFAVVDALTGESGPLSAKPSPPTISKITPRKRRK